nr:hypothetical protein [Tanacetum cinerariifolium]
MVRGACGLEVVIRTSWTNRNPCRRFYGCPTLTQRKAQQENELSNLTRQRQLLVIVNYKRAIIKELERLLGKLMACKTTEHLKRIQKAVFVEALIPKVKSISNKDLFHSNSSLYLFALFSFLDSSDHRVGISNSLSESDKHTLLGEQVVGFFSIYVNGCRKGLDIDDSNLLLTPVIRPTNNTHIVPKITTTHTLFSSQNNQVDNCVVKPIRIIPGPVGIVQKTKLCKLVDTWEGGEESVMSTQEYIRKVIVDVCEDDDFTRASWLSTIDYVNIDGGIVTGCFGDVKKFLKNGKLEQIVAVIKSCTSNSSGDLTVTLKDLSGTIFSAIHYKVLIEERFAKAFTIGSALILHNVSVFSPKQSTHHYLNITKKNMVKVFHKDDRSA